MTYRRTNLCALLRPAMVFHFGGSVMAAPEGPKIPYATRWDLKYGARSEEDPRPDRSKPRTSASMVAGMGDRDRHPG